MSTPYPKFNWFYPPRTKLKSPYRSPTVELWKNLGDTWAQHKRNGSNDQMAVSPNGEIQHWSRHKIDPITGKDSPRGEPKKLDYVMPKKLRDEVLSFTPKGSWTIYNVELMHQKTPTVKDTLYFFDVLVWGGKHLIGSTYAERYSIIEEPLKGRYYPMNAPRLDGQIYIAQNFMPPEWDKAWKDAQPDDTCEGLVLKRTGGASCLQHGVREFNNDGLFIRCRKPTKNFRH